MRLRWVAICDSTVMLVIVVAVLFLTLMTTQVNPDVPSALRNVLNMVVKDVIEVARRV
jgi:hypothetical protein